MHSSLLELCFQCIAPHKTAKGIFSDGQGILVGSLDNTQGTWELKSVVVLSNAQLFTRGLLIYNRVREVPLYIPQGYMKGRLIYRRYVEEPCESRDVMRTSNDGSYA